MITKPTFPQLIQGARRKRGWPLRVVASQLDCTVTAIHQYESGRRAPGPRTLASIIRLLRIEPKAALAAAARTGTYR